MVEGVMCMGSDRQVSPLAPQNRSAGCKGSTLTPSGNVQVLFYSSFNPSINEPRAAARVGFCNMKGEEKTALAMATPHIALQA